MLPVLGYLLCLVLVVPAVGLALFFWLVDQIASSPIIPGLGRVALWCLEFLGTPWRVGVAVLLVTGVVAAGCLRTSRGWACLVIGLVGAISLAQILISARPTESGQIIALIPSTLATGASLWWAWSIIKSDFFG